MNTNQYNIPILFIIFRRKDIALESFESIRKVKPLYLYIACDGARDGVNGEVKKVEETRQAILNAIDWECDVHTLFRDHNLGCSEGVYSAINWLFEHEERGIIIEDDCVMRSSFFPFVEEMLERYNNDERIGMIDGANYMNTPIPYSYGFSRFKSTNGWATWKRAWINMDLDMNWRGGKYEESILANTGYRAKDKKYWKYRLKAIDSHTVSAWDWQWYFTLAAQNQLGIYPNISLQTNIGFGEDATHTSSNSTPDRYISKGEMIFPLQHPKYVVPYEPFEKEFFQQNVTLFERIKELFPIRIKELIKKMIR